jgi:hypothetical protein
MKMKIFGIVVCMLLVSISISSVAGSINNKILDVTSGDYCYLVDQIRVGNIVSSDWLELKITASDGAADDNLGTSVSIDGEYVIVGAHGDDSYKGSAYIFKRTGTAWAQQQKLTASDGVAGDDFGCSVSIDGEYVIVGARYASSNFGSAYIFKRTGTAWAQQQKLTASDGAAWDYFGHSVSINGEYAVIGAFQDDSKGSAYIFKRSITTWTQQQKITAADGEVNDEFGTSVSIDGDYALFGALHDDDNGDSSGSSYVFKREGTTWIQQQKLTASDGTTSDRFGVSVSINDEYILIGMSRDDSNKGSAYVFKRSSTVWTEQQKLTASDGAAGDIFGYSVSIDGKYALIGAAADDDDKGSAYVFKRSDTTWDEEKKLTASDGELNDEFGFSVSIYETYAIVGARNDDDKGQNSGALYLYKGAVPNLECVGSLSWTDVLPGNTVTDEFVLANVGDAGSEMSWEIESNPTWGTWTFIPSSGTDLTPEMGSLTIYVEVIAPDQQNQEFTGEIKVVNSDDSDDYDIIPVTLNTPKSKTFNFNSFLLRFLDQHPNMFHMLRHLLGL